MRFLDALHAAKKTGRSVVIPDIKCISPKEGDLLRGRDPVAMAKTLVAAGAPVLSVVTEPNHFGGSEELLREIAAAVSVPILRKDFLETPDDIRRTKELGASAVLLMYACLPPEQLAMLYHTAKEIGLDVLVETHHGEEMAHARALGAQLIGINNRNIQVLERDSGDVSCTQTLAAEKPAGAFLISESSLMTPDDVRAALHAGADAALVGTAIWQAEHPAQFYRHLCRPIQVKVCGFMSAEDVALGVAEGADLLGFVVNYPVAVPWNLTEAQAAPLIAAVPDNVRSCLVTGGKPADILALAKRLRPDTVQLHYKENLAETLFLTEQLHAMGMRVIRSIPASGAQRKAQFGTDDLGVLAKSLATVDALLMDARCAENASELVHSAPLAPFCELQQHSGKPVVLAGGITAENVQALLHESGAKAIDVLSGTEETPGKKSPEKLHRLMAQL